MRTDSILTIALQPATGVPLALEAFVFTDQLLRGRITGASAPADSILLFRQQRGLRAPPSPGLSS